MQNKKFTHIQRANSRLKQERERDREKPSIDLGGKGPGANDDIDGDGDIAAKGKKSRLKFARKPTRSEEATREERGGVRCVFTHSESINRHVAAYIRTFPPLSRSVSFLTVELPDTPP